VAGVDGNGQGKFGHQTFTNRAPNVRPENIFLPQTFSIIKNVRTRQDQIKAMIERGYMIMKKFVSIVLTTGLLMGTVAFGALACGAGERDQNHNQPVPRQKKVVVVQERERHQPPVARRVQPKPEKELVIKVRAKKPGVVKVAVKPDSAPKPAPKHEKSVMPYPQDGPRR
jgi:hypothetical protein